jgi:hypothetical protein
MLEDLQSLSAEFMSLQDRLSRMSSEGHYNPYTLFDWPDSLPEPAWYMSADLLSVRGTPAGEALSDEQLQVLSKWESVNFYSLNVHGIRELLMEVTLRIHTPGFEPLSEFLHHFLGEENQHMWFFAEFCRRYGGKLYADKRVKLGLEGQLPAEVQDFLVFARILIFEEVVDFYNTRMARDEALAPIIRQLNAVHHQDESRHIAFGRRLLEHLHERLCERITPEQHLELEAYLKRYIQLSLNSLYNPAVYRDAGLPDPYGLRNELLRDPIRHIWHERLLARTTGFLVKSRIFSTPEVATHV